MKYMLLGVPTCAALCLASIFFGSPAAQSQSAGAGPASDKTMSNGVMVKEDAALGALVYVPIYSHIHYDDSTKTLELAATLTIHNVNPDHSITVVKADYYDTSGKRIHQYIPEPLVLQPLETKHLIIEKSNTAGGLGANFLVEWRADEEVGMPIVEAVMINASHNLGIAFTSGGKVIQRTHSATK